MGYYTNYQLSVVDGIDFCELLSFGEVENFFYLKIKQRLANTEYKENIDDYFVRMKGYQNKIGVDFIKDYLNPAYQNNLCEVKWYEHEGDMKRVSKCFPETLFILEGDGEEKGDIWRKYFKNGKMQVSKVVISFDAFNESKLK